MYKVVSCLIRTSSIGIFDFVPLEITSHILSFLDASSLFNVRRLNSTFKEISAFHLSPFFGLDRWKVFSFAIKDPVDLLFSHPSRFLTFLSEPFEQNRFALRLSNRLNLSTSSMSSFFLRYPHGDVSFPLVLSGNSGFACLLNGHQVVGWSLGLIRVLPFSMTFKTGVKSICFSNNSVGILSNDGCFYVPSLSKEAVMKDVFSCFSQKSYFVFRMNNRQFICWDPDASKKVILDFPPFLHSVKEYSDVNSLVFQLDDYQLLGVHTDFFPEVIPLMIYPQKKVRSIFGLKDGAYLAWLESDVLIVWGQQGNRVLRDHGDIIVWGTDDKSFELPPIPVGRKIEHVSVSYASSWISVVLDDGKILFWNVFDDNGVVGKSLLPQGSSVQKILSMQNAFIAMLNEGDFFYWTTTSSIGKTAGHYCGNNRLKDIFSNDYGCLFLFQDNKICYFDSNTMSFLDKRFPSDCSVKKITLNFHNFYILTDKGDLFSLSCFRPSCGEDLLLHKIEMPSGLKCLDIFSSPSSTENCFLASMSNGIFYFGCSHSIISNQPLSLPKDASIAVLDDYMAQL